ncbi:MAG TPA: hypothetical protein VKU80_09485 [Planctomycetota bacterium]|nr:hypothetical protein [Planctomycetota bacterium]
MNFGLATAFVAILSWTGTAWEGSNAPRGLAPRASNITAYKTLADETLKAFKAGDLATAKKKAKELEKAWDTTGKTDLAKKQELWKEIDTAMDGFIDPILKEEKPDPANVEAGYKDFIAKLNKAA